jgi:hypothetical protein
MQTYFIVLRIGTQEWNFKAECHDMHELARSIHWLNAGLQIHPESQPSGDRPVLVDLATSRRRGIEYIDLAEWVR